jgi:pyruvate kinase
MLQRNAAELFGRVPASRQTRIMVTMPGDAGDDPQFARALVEGGMNCARINCAHDSPDVWRAIIGNVRRASREVGRKCSVLVDIAGPKMRIERVEFAGSEELVRFGDTIVLAHGEYGPRVSGAARAYCRLPEIFPALQPGQRVMIDEGRIGARVVKADKNGAVLHVDHARPTGEKLRAQKGLNFPDTHLGLSPVTRDDRVVLDTIAPMADLIGYSFVRDPEDVDLLVRELEGRCRTKLPGIVLKIETARAVTNLPALIVQSARRVPTAVMIARGDLAVEIGYRRLAEIQEELLWICEAASVPVVWATQVLDTFVKKGRRSRAEFTDAAMAERADCVMLNKGPYIFDALSQIDDLLGRMEGHQTKKTSRLRALHSW